MDDAKSAADDAAPVTTDFWENGFFEFELRSPIPADGDETKTLKLRKPTTADIMEAGDPVEVDFASDPPTYRIDDRKMGRMLSRMADLPPSSIGKLDPQDYKAIKMLVASRFFTLG